MKNTVWATFLLADSRREGREAECLNNIPDTFVKQVDQS